MSSAKTFLRWLSAFSLTARPTPGQRTLYLFRSHEEKMLRSMRSTQHFAIVKGPRCEVHYHLGLLSPGTMNPLDPKPIRELL
ncbi:hypothetical protein F5883DRAFT_263724 [Diaporthe sp. PMI_573]|nr:hypothetical protein F5883DRAFT_263724 [Diaporthaceae sp. PMI_573]